MNEVQKARSTFLKINRNKTVFATHALVFLLTALLVSSTVLVHHAEANRKSYKASILFADFQHEKYKGNTTVKIINLETQKILGEKEFDFKKINDGSFDCCIGKMKFESKGSHTGDHLRISSIDKGKNGGNVTDDVQLVFNKGDHNYHIKISLDEFGCDDCA